MNGLTLPDEVFAEGEPDESPMLPSAEDEGRLSLEAMVLVRLRGDAADEDEVLPFLWRGMEYCDVKVYPESPGLAVTSSWCAIVLPVEFRGVGDKGSALS